MSSVMFSVVFKGTSSGFFVTISDNFGSWITSSDFNGVSAVIGSTLTSFGTLFKSKITWSVLLLIFLAISFISLLLFKISSLDNHKFSSIDLNSSLSDSVNFFHFQIIACFCLFSKAQYLIILLSLGLLITLTGS